MDAITYQVLLRHNPWLESIEIWPETVRSHLPALPAPDAFFRYQECCENGDAGSISLKKGCFLYLLYVYFSFIKLKHVARNSSFSFSNKDGDRLSQSTNFDPSELYFF